MHMMNDLTADSYAVTVTTPAARIFRTTASTKEASTKKWGSHEFS